MSTDRAAARNRRIAPPARRARALLQPRAVVARLQRARARARRGRELPLLERAKFLAIHTRTSTSSSWCASRACTTRSTPASTARQADGLTAAETIDRIARSRGDRNGRHSGVWEELRPALAEPGIRIVTCAQLRRGAERGRSELRGEIFPVLTPLGVGPGRPFPYISNLSLSLAVTVRDPTAATRRSRASRCRRRCCRGSSRSAASTFVPLEEVIARNLHQLFPGMEILAHDVFRVTRDADFTVSDEADDLLAGRRAGAAPAPLRRGRPARGRRDDERRAARAAHRVAGRRGAGGLRRRRACSTTTTCGRSTGSTVLATCATRRTRPSIPPAFRPDEDGESPTSSRRSASGDVLVHHPYESFAASVERFVEQAVEDPDVLAIKMTVYRDVGRLARSSRR